MSSRPQLSKVHSSCPFNIESFHLTVNLLDRFCSKKTGLTLYQYRLAAFTCLLIASKYEETIALSIQYLAEITQREAGPFHNAEKVILRTLDWELNFPGPTQWLRRLSKADNLDVFARTIGKFLCEVACLASELIGTPPSLLAAASFWLARLSLGREDWTPTLQRVSTYQEHELFATGNTLLGYILSPDVFTIQDHETQEDTIMDLSATAVYRRYACKSQGKAGVRFCRWVAEIWSMGAVVDIALCLDELKGGIRVARMSQQARDESD